MDQRGCGGAGGSGLSAASLCSPCKEAATDPAVEIALAVLLALDAPAGNCTSGE